MINSLGRSGEATLIKVSSFDRFLWIGLFLWKCDRFEQKAVDFGLTIDDSLLNVDDY